eukprot:754257-Pyramimonas_sp.AAC.1
MGSTFGLVHISRKIGFEPPEEGHTFCCPCPWVGSVYICDPRCAPLTGYAKTPYGLVVCGTVAMFLLAFVVSGMFDVSRFVLPTNTLHHFFAYSQPVVVRSWSYAQPKQEKIVYNVTFLQRHIPIHVETPEGETRSQPELPPPKQSFPTLRVGGLLRCLPTSRWAAWA